MFPDCGVSKELAALFPCSPKSGLWNYCADAGNSYI